MARVRGLREIISDNTNELLRVSGTDTILSTVSGNIILEKIGVGTKAEISFGANAQVLFKDNLQLLLDTVDGSDNKSIQVSAAGAIDSSRSALVQVYGNEYPVSGFAGYAVIQTGTASLANIRLMTNNTDGFIELWQNGNVAWFMDANKSWLPGSNLTYKLGDASHKVDQVFARQIVNGTGHFDFTELQYIGSANYFVVHADTSDGTDNKALLLTGGGAGVLNDNTRGGQVVIFGNEHATDSGGIRIVAGPAGSISMTGTTTQIRSQGGNHILTHQNNELIIQTGSTQFNIRSSTTDGNDTKRLQIAAGGDAVPGRGAFIIMDGADNASFGLLQLSSSDTTNSSVRIASPASNGFIDLSTAGTSKWRLQFSGEWVPQLDQTYDIGRSDLRVQKLYVKAVDSLDIVDNELPTGSINGINTVYTTGSNFISSSLKVYLNGLRLTPGVGFDFTVTGANQFTIAYPPSSGDVLLVDYRKNL